MNREKILSMIGLATRAGKTKSGEFMTETVIKEGKAMLVIVAEDASQNTVKNFTDMCAFRKIPMIRIGTKEELGRSTGKEMRASLVILDKGFAEAVLKLFE